jgi:hypothetical protein
MALQDSIHLPHAEFVPRNQRPRIVIAVTVLRIAAACADGSPQRQESAATTATPTVATTGKSERPAAPTTSITATSSTTTTTSTTTTAAPPPVGELVLRSDGLGVVSFGDPVDTVLPLLEQALGRRPTSDITETGDLPFGYGGRGTTVRIVGFDGLGLVFTAWPYFRDDGVVHVVSWGVGVGGTIDLATPEGIRPGSTVDELRAAYGDRLRLPPEPDECTGSWHFFVGTSPTGLMGTLDGPPSDPQSSAIGIGAGFPATC